MQHSNSELKKEWEVPEIDLNLRHYSGSVCDVFKKIKQDIVNSSSNNTEEDNTASDNSVQDETQDNEENEQDSNSAENNIAE